MERQPLVLSASDVLHYCVVVVAAAAAAACCLALRKSGFGQPQKCVCICVCVIVKICDDYACGFSQYLDVSTVTAIKQNTYTHN